MEKGGSGGGEPIIKHGIVTLTVTGIYKLTLSIMEILERLHNCCFFEIFFISYYELYSFPTLSITVQATPSSGYHGRKYISA